VGGRLCRACAGKSGKSIEDMQSILDAETWLNAEEALAAGLVDSIESGCDEGAEKKKKKKEKMNSFDLSVFANVPDKLKGIKSEPTVRDLEQALRDAGLSNKQAKAILAEGIKDGVRDELPAEKPELPVEDAPRDVEQPAPKKKDRTNDLLIRAERIAPTPT